MVRVDTRRLQLLLALSRLGSMRAVADTHHLTTSTVSQQIAALAKETGAQLIEPEGRRVRLTPAGRRLADHAVEILAAVDAARLDLDPDADPAGTLRVGGFATGIRVSLLPILADLTARHPGIDVLIHEYEPIEAFALLADDDLDLALTYDYNLAPASPGPALDPVPMWSTAWGLGVPELAASRMTEIEIGRESAVRRKIWVSPSPGSAPGTKKAFETPVTTGGASGSSESFKMRRIKASVAGVQGRCASG